MMMRLLGIFLALVLAAAAVPAAFSYQEDQGPLSQDRDKFSFNGYSNSTQLLFGGYSNQTFPGFNQTNRGQEISYLVHEINYLRQELLNLIKEQQKDDNKTKLHEQQIMSSPTVSANKTFVPNPAHEIMTGKINPNTRGPHHGHR
jgi:hypothetical protein